jgi:hypothetical protein
VTFRTICSFIPDANNAKEDIRAVYDGSIFQRIADKREKKMAMMKKKRL